MSKKTKKVQRKRRHWHIRRKLDGKATKPRMAVFRSAKHIYVQLINDETGQTLCSASTQDKEITAGTGNKEGAALVGKKAAEKALAAGITTVVFDRAGFRFHGRVKELADAAREAGLKF